MSCVLKGRISSGITVVFSTKRLAVEYAINFVGCMFFEIGNSWKVFISFVDLKWILKIYGLQIDQNNN